MVLARENLNRSIDKTIIHEEAETVIISIDRLSGRFEASLGSRWWYRHLRTAMPFGFQWYYQRSSKEDISDKRSWQCMQIPKYYEQHITSTHTDTQVVIQLPHTIALASVLTVLKVLQSKTHNQTKSVTKTKYCKMFLNKLHRSSCPAKVSTNASPWLKPDGRCGPLKYHVLLEELQNYLPPNISPTYYWSV